MPPALGTPSCQYSPFVPEHNEQILERRLIDVCRLDCLVYVFKSFLCIEAFWFTSTPTNMFSHCRLNLENSPFLLLFSDLPVFNLFPYEIPIQIYN